MKNLFTTSLLAAAAVSSAQNISSAIDAFDTADSITVGNGFMVGDTLTGIGAYGIFERTLSLTGNRAALSQLIVDADSNQIIASTPGTAGALTTFEITYTLTGSINFLINQDVQNTHLDLTLLASDKASSFTWTALITGQPDSSTLTYTQNFGVTSSATLYSIALDDFTNNTSQSLFTAWQGVRKLTLTINPVNAMDVTFSSGFYRTLTTPVPEASTYGIALGGLAIAAAVVRRRKQAK